MTRRGWLAFGASSIVWGVPYLFIKLADDGGMTPLTLAWGRVTLAAVLLCVFAWRRGTLGAVRGHGRWLLAYAVGEVVVPFSCIAFGEQRIASSLTAIVIAAVPLVGAVLAIRFDVSERVTGARALGLLVGFGGVVALVGIDVAGSGHELVGAGAVLVAAVGYAIGPMIIKLKLGGLDASAAMGASLAIAAVILTPLAALDLPGRAPTAGAFVDVAVLGVLCTAVAFVVYTTLVREVGSGRATVITYVNPVIALGLGVAVLGERPGLGAIAGLGLILAGSWWSTGGSFPRGWNRTASVRAAGVPGTVGGSTEGPGTPR